MTGPPEPTTRTERTRRALLAAGRELFAAQGPESVTSHAIATHAGYAAGTFYLHFKDKHALFRELAENAAAELEARLIRVAGDKTDPADITWAQADALVGFAEEQRDLLRIVFHRGRSGRSDDRATDIGAGILERLAQGISDRRRERLTHQQAADERADEQNSIASGMALCSPGNLSIEAANAQTILAQAIVGMWAHVLAWWAEDPSRASREDLVRTLAEFQLHGTGPKGLPGC